LRNADSQATTKKQKEGQAGIPSINILNSIKITNVGKIHVGRQSLGGTREKLIEHDIANEKQLTLHQINKS